MKKIFLLSLSILLCSQVTACGKTVSTETTVAVETVSKLSDEEQKNELDSIYKEIEEANDYCNSLSKLVFTYWDYNGYEAFFDRDIFDEKDTKYNTSKNYTSGTFYGDAKASYQYRDKITEKMEDAHAKLKDLEVSDKLKDYYELVKKLYLNVDAFYSFASSFPEGYSQVTYSQTFSKHQSEYDSLVSELKFEQ